MKRFFFLLIRPWILSLIGVTLLSLVIWFEAPLVSFKDHELFASATVRWCWIIIGYLIWAGVLIWNWFLVRRANAALINDMSEASKDSAQELDTIKKRMQEALAILKNSRFGNKRAGLYQLPWYIFIGEPGSGKTTALVHSGLTFPLAETMGKAAIGGVGGTRHCEWWFTEDAVLLDTAGRYTSQDSDQDKDRSAWNGFLKMLRKYRPRRPINGVIITVSIADLLQQTELQRTQQAHNLRARINELHVQLGIRFPIYVMVTKCDLLAGFTDFFEPLGREERAQVWGMTFPLFDANEVDTALASFPAEFALLETQLQSRLLARMQQERDKSRRALLFRFPQQFAGVGEILEVFLQQVFQATRYEQAPLLRGVYFTSGTQEGTPIDRVMGAIAGAFGLDSQVLSNSENSGRSYFITHLLRQVIFPEAELVGVNLGLERRRRTIQWLASGGLMLFLLVAGGLLINSYMRNQNYIDTLGKQTLDINQLAVNLPAHASEVQMLPLLNALRNIPGGYDTRDQAAPLLMRFGLNQQDKLGSGAEDVYQQVLIQTLLPRLLTSLEEQLRRNTANSNDYMYETLRVYLMLGDMRHFDPESVTAWLDYYWSHNVKEADASQLAMLSGHAQALMDALSKSSKTLQLNADLITQTRLTLASMTIQQRIYNRLKRDLMRSKLPEFSVSSSAGNSAAQVLVQRNGMPLSRGINGMFTVAGYQIFKERNPQAIADIVKDSWVMAQQETVGVADTEQVKAAVTQLYFADYIAQWDALLTNVSIVPFSTLDQGARVVNQLAGADSPIRQFLIAVSKETTLAPATVAPSEGGGVKDKLAAYKKKLDDVLDGNTETAPAVVTIANPVDVHFEDLHKLTAAPVGGSSALDTVLAMLKEMALYLDASGAAKRSGIPAPASEVVSKLKLTAENLPQPLAQMLQAINSTASGMTSGSERERLNSLWSGGAGQFCRLAIAGRYPIVRSATKEVTADDFGKFFSPNGIMDDFFSKNLLQYVDTGGKQWHWRSTAQNTSMGISQESLDVFQRAARIRDAFFGTGGNQASMRFELKPISIDPQLASLSLDIDGQNLNIAGGGVGRGTQFTLPSGKGVAQVRFDAVPALRSDWHTEGNWAWFRMIDKGVLESTGQAERFKISFNLDGKKAVFELSANSVINPFQREVLEQFHCMDSLK